jgi:hypothetical protein
MNTILRLEELAMFGLSLFGFTLLDISWWWYAGCILLPDVGMVGYLHNSRTGAYAYNLFHHKGIALLIYSAGIYFHNDPLLFAGIILFSHASMDRMLGFGLKYEKGFRYTHLGELPGQSR